MMKLCPCGSEIEYSNCCGLYIHGGLQPSSPEVLMRSRYTAYTLAKISYIQNTMRGKALIGFNKAEARRWAKRVAWVGLHVLKVSPVERDKGFVEFIARFKEAGQVQSIHEISEFHRIDGTWYYVDGFLEIDPNSSQ